MFHIFSDCIQIRRRRGLVGCLLGLALGCLLLLRYQAPREAVLYGCLFAVTGFLRLEPRGKFPRAALWVLWSAACVGLTLLYPYYEIYIQRMWSEMDYYTKPYAYILNTVLILAAMTLVYAVSGSWRFSVTAVTAAFSLLVLANGYVYFFREKELLFPDIFAAQTAANVLDQYDMTMKFHSLKALSFITLVLFWGGGLPECSRQHRWRPRVAALAAGIALAAAFSLNIRDRKVITWRTDGTLMNGYYMNFCISIRDYFLEEPEGYSQEAIRELEAAYPQPAAGAQAYPNVLVIMSEAYADLSILGEQPRTNIPVTPFLDSLEENTIRGYALASVFGGTTANSEFEALSGCSLHFLPEGATPYQQYLQRDTYSLGWALESLGYRCMTTHPFFASGWNRTAVYPILGFSESTFIEAYPQENLVRSYISDQEMFEYLLDTLEQEADREGPAFLFGVTMQNHGGYGSLEDTRLERVELEGYDAEYPQAENYLTLIHESDKALEYLLTSLQESEEKTVVLFFGDHLPTVESSFFQELHGSGLNSLEEKMLQYTVPFFIWANYDIPEQTVERTSLNYLGRYLLEAAGIDLPPYYQFLKEAEEVIPALNVFGYYSKEAGEFITGDQAQGLEAQWLNRYNILQYNSIHDKSGRSAHFFGDYIS